MDCTTYNLKVFLKSAKRLPSGTPRLRESGPTADDMRTKNGVAFKICRTTPQTLIT